MDSLWFEPFCCSGTKGVWYCSAETSPHLTRLHYRSTQNYSSNSEYHYLPSMSTEKTLHFTTIHWTARQLKSNYFALEDIQPSILFFSHKYWFLSLAFFFFLICDTHQCQLFIHKQILLLWFQLTHLKFGFKIPQLSEKYLRSWNKNSPQKMV